MRECHRTLDYTPLTEKMHVSFELSGQEIGDKCTTIGIGAIWKKNVIAKIHQFLCQTANIRNDTITVVDMRIKRTQLACLRLTADCHLLDNGYRKGEVPYTFATARVWYIRRGVYTSW